MTNKKPIGFTILNAPMPLAQYPIKSTYAMPNPIGVTIHETDSNASARQEIAYMQGNTNWVSFHFAVDEKEIVQGAPLDRVTWQSGDGNGNGNMRTISIEICRNYRTDDLTNYYAARANAEKLVGWLLYVYGWDAKNIYTHNDWSGKNCPRVIRREGYLNTFKQKAVEYRDQYTAVTPEPVQPTPITKLEVGQKVKIKANATTYQNVNANIPNWVKKQTHTILQADVSNERVLLKEIYSWVRMTDIEGFEGNVAPAPGIKLGDMVIVKRGAKSYDGANVIQDWYTVPKRVDALKGNRAVLDIGGWITPFKVSDLTKYTAAPAPKPAEPAKPTIQKGSNVTANGKTYRDSYGGGYGGIKNVKGKVTYLNLGAPYPYHVASTGWFAAKDVKLVAAAAPRTYKVGDRVHVNGRLHVNSAGANPGATINRVGYITYTNPGSKFPYHIDNVGWVAAKDVK